MHASHKALFRMDRDSGKVCSFENREGLWHAIVEVIDFDLETNHVTAHAFAYGGPADEAPSRIIKIIEDVSYGTAWDAALEYGKKHDTPG